jgi:CYTH domain-containing protein
MAELSIPVPKKVRHRQSDEIYIVSRTNDINNTKIRDGKMDIKTYVQTIDGLEQWNPLMKAEFPISSAILRNDVFPAFQVEMPKLTKDEYSMSEFLEMIDENPNLQAVRVHKERYGYMVNDTICEVANVLINGAKVVTINSESTEIEDIKKTMNDVNLNNIENINYLQVINKKESIKEKRITQGYLSSVPERTVRVRIKGEKGFITIKGMGNESGATRFEWEKEISVKDTKDLLKLCEAGIIDKTRYNVKSGKHTFEVDEFYGENAGLTVAEIELSSEDEKFDKPDWLGEEVTGDVKYFNSMLMKNPYLTWKKS